jgi:hypothetical protein
MDTNQVESFRDVLKTIHTRSPSEWVYLPYGGTWSLDSLAITLESDEVPPELEDDPDAGIPQFAKQHNLMQVIPVGSLQDVVSNALQQKPNATPEELFIAFRFYYSNDAFMEM